jgi:hypothetical protein
MRFLFARERLVFYLILIVFCHWRGSFRFSWRCFWWPSELLVPSFEMPLQSIEPVRSVVASFAGILFLVCVDQNMRFEMVLSLKLMLASWAHVRSFVCMSSFVPQKLSRSYKRPVTTCEGAFVLLILVYLLYNHLWGATGRYDRRVVLLKLKEPIANEKLDTTLQNQQNNSAIVASSSSSEMIVEKIHENKKHKCTFTGCDRSFVRPAELLRHKRTHTNERPYVCPTCKHEFKRKDHLKSHILIHTDEKKYSCKRCDYRTNRLDTLKRHFKTRHQKLGGPPETSPAKAKAASSVAEYNQNQVEY